MKSLVFSLTVYTTAVGHIGSNNLNLWVYINCSLVTDVSFLLCTCSSLSLSICKGTLVIHLLCVCIHTSIEMGNGLSLWLYRQEE